MYYCIPGPFTKFWVGNLWRCSDSLFFRVPPLTSNALLTMLHPLSKNVLQTINHFKISCLGPSFSWLEKPRNHMGQDLNWILCSAWKKWISGIPLEHLPYSPYLAPYDLWAFPTIKRELQGKNFTVINGLHHIFEKWMEHCKKSSLVSRGTSKKRLSPHLHKVLTWNNKVSPRTFQTALVIWICYPNRKWNSSDKTACLFCLTFFASFLKWVDGPIQHQLTVPVEMGCEYILTNVRYEKVTEPFRCCRSVQTTHTHTHTHRGVIPKTMFLCPWKILLC
jgi:hypothetical protein